MALDFGEWIVSQKDHQRDSGFCNCNGKVVICIRCLKVLRWLHLTPHRLEPFKAPYWAPSLPDPFWTCDTCYGDLLGNPSPARREARDRERDSKSQSKIFIANLDRESWLKFIMFFSENLDYQPQPSVE